MFMKIIAAAAVMAAPAALHAQGTTKLPQDTTHAMTHIRTDSTKVDTASGSVVTKTKTTITDSARVSRTHADSARNLSPIDSTRMVEPAAHKTPPR